MLKVANLVLSQKYKEFKGNRNKNQQSGLHQTKKLSGE